jgi:hypothetical protein
VEFTPNAEADLDRLGARSAQGKQGSVLENEDFGVHKRNKKPDKQ